MTTSVHGQSHGRSVGGDDTVAEAVDRLGVRSFRGPDAEGRAEEIDLPNHTAYLVHDSGEAIEVRDPGETYLIKMRTNFFEVDTALPPKN
jgi:hypothetical protein